MNRRQFLTLGAVASGTFAVGGPLPDGQPALHGPAGGLRGLESARRGKI